MPERSRVFMYGRYKSLKSILALNLALSVASGQDWLGFDTVPTPVMVLQTEMPHVQVRNRLALMTNGHTQQPLWIWTEHYLKLDTIAGMNAVSRNLSKYEPKLLIVDPLYKVISANILDPNVIRGFLDNVDLLIEKHNISVLIVSHSRKGNAEREREFGNVDDMLGAGIFSAWADTVIKVTRKPGIGDNYVAEVSFEMTPRYATDDVEPIQALISKATLVASTLSPISIAAPTKRSKPMSS